MKHSKFFSNILCTIVMGIVALFVFSGATPSWALQVSPGSLAFSAISGGADPAAQWVNLSNPHPRSRTWSASTSASWLSLSPSSGPIGSVNESVGVTARVNGLAAGSYSGTITFAEATSNGKVRTSSISVSLTLTGTANPPIIQLNPTGLNFSGFAGSSNPSSQSFTISNGGGGTLTWNASGNSGWLALSQTAGTNAGTINATVNLSGLVAGTYTGSITVAAPEATTKSLPVSLTVSNSVSSGTPVIGLSPTSVGFTGMAGGTNPAAQTISITNTGTGTLTWTMADDAGWLSLTPASGTNTGAVSATVNTAGLAAGTYTATVTATATGAAPKTVPVTLTISPSGAGSATISWNANSETDLAGYKIYYGTQSGVYGAPVVLGKVTSYIANNLTRGTTYFFTITAYDSAGNESPRSSEVSKSIF